jgi:hypothetical protein
LVVRAKLLLLAMHFDNQLNTTTRTTTRTRTIFWGCTKPASGMIGPSQIQLFFKILLRGWKRSLISATRPNTLGGSEDEVNEILKIRVDQKL